MMSAPRRSLLLSLLAAAFLAGAAAGRARAQEAPAAGSLAVVLFIEGRPQAGAPVPVGELRQSLLSRLHATGAAAGHRLAPQAAVEAIVADLRVRSGAALPPDFLARLRRDTDAATLLVVTLLADEGRFLVAARQMDTGDGTLRHVALAERLLPTGEEDAGRRGARPAADAQPWRTALLECSREIMPPTATPTPAGRLVLLQPAIGAGVASSDITMAAHCLMGRILAGGEWRVLDPALVRGALQDAGRDPDALDDAGRRLLVTEFAPAALVMTELLSYDERSSQATPLLIDGASPAAARGLPAFAWHLRVVEPASGVVTGACEIYDDHSGSVGWFGARHNPTLLLQLEDAAARLWLLARPQLEDM